MSQPDLSSVSPPRGVLVQKPKTSVYTVMLIVSLVAMVIGCIFLVLEIQRFGGFGAVKGRISAVHQACDYQVASSESPAELPLDIG